MDFDHFWDLFWNLWDLSEDWEQSVDLNSNTFDLSRRRSQIFAIEMWYYQREFKKKMFILGLAIKEFFRKSQTLLSQCPFFPHKKKSAFEWWASILRPSPFTPIFAGGSTVITFFLRLSYRRECFQMAVSSLEALNNRDLGYKETNKSLSNIQSDLILSNGPVLKLATFSMPCI